MSSVLRKGKAIDFENLKAVLFDIDGTITHSDDLHFFAFQKLLAEVGFNDGKPITEEFFKTQISGGHNPEITARLFPTWTEEKRAEFSDFKEAYFRDMAGSVLKPMKGLPEFLDWLEERGIRKVVVTNAPRPNAELMLESLKLEHRFEHVVLGEECSRAKPFPDPYLAGLEFLGVKAEEAMVLEDSLLGVRSGVAAGIPVVGVLSTQEEEALEEVGATATVRDFTHLMEIIEKQQKEKEKQQQN